METIEWLGSVTFFSALEKPQWQVTSEKCEKPVQAHPVNVIVKWGFELGLHGRTILVSNGICTEENKCLGYFEA